MKPTTTILEVLNELENKDYIINKYLKNVLISDYNIDKFLKTNRDENVLTSGWTWKEFITHELWLFYDKEYVLIGDSIIKNLKASEMVDLLWEEATPKQIIEKNFANRVIDYDLTKRLVDFKN